MQQTRGGGVEIHAVPLRNLMTAAWDIDQGHPERIAGLPQWAQSARFDVNAKPPANANGMPILGSGYIDEEALLMLKPADREVSDQMALRRPDHDGMVARRRQAEVDRGRCLQTRYMPERKNRR